VVKYRLCVLTQKAKEKGKGGGERCLLHGDGSVHYRDNYTRVNNLISTVVYFHSMSFNKL